MEQAVKVFEETSRVKVDIVFGGSGTLLSQMKLARRGDVYIPGSPDFMVIAERQNLVDASTVKKIAYLVPAINVQAGNPKNIKTLSDLAKPGLRVGIGNPEAVCLGLYAVELLERNNLLDPVNRNIVTHAPSCEATESLLALKKVDAVIGWDVFSHWSTGKIETIFPKPGEIVRLAYIPAAVSVFTQDKAMARRFVDFLVSPEARKIFGANGYAVSEEQVRKYAPDAKIGGEYVLPKGYRGK
jgi:molybdate transport system substrate-binding protein